MLNDPTSKCGILFVDDEEKALKYFSMAFSQKFNVFTAASGAEGIEVLRREAGRIGVVLSDQRMPGMLGAEFLGMVREEFPRIVRILTTAYSDLESAIQAVNTGHIYQYVVKPWEVAELGMVLRRAADYYYVLSERNELLALKMTTLQRIVCSDRLKWMLLHSHSLSDRKQSAFRRALASFVKALPEESNPIVSAGEGFQQRDFEIGGLIRDEYLNAARCLDLMNDWASSGVAQPLPDTLTAQISGLASTDSGEVWSVPDSLRVFISILIDYGFAAEEITLEIDAAFNIAVTLKPGAESFDRANFIRALFGLLVERQTPVISVRFFETLLATSLAGGTLTLTVESRAADGEPSSLAFHPANESDDVEGIISELYEKFSQSDISRL
jgi:CheY-like chemotaxis protein